MNLLLRFYFRILWAALCGLLLVGEFPPFNAYGFLVVPSIAGLLLLLRGMRGRRARMIGFAWGMAAFGGSVSWLWGLFQWFALALFAILALFIALFAWMQSKAEERGLNGWSLILFTTVNWSAWEFIRAELFPLKFPWITPGMAWGPGALLPWVGVYGMSALLVLVVSLVVSKRPQMIGMGVLLLLALVWSRMWSPVEVDASRAVHIAAVQAESVSMEHRIQRTEMLAPDVRVAIWPEYSIPYDLRANSSDYQRMVQLCKVKNLILVLGTETPLPDKSGTWNTALTLDASGVLGEHYKVHPVHFFNDGVPGKSSLPVKTPLGMMGTPICFDCDYEGVVRKMTMAGAEFFSVPSMDVDSWGARQHQQHSMLFRIRACENGRWMAVCASSGISQIVDPHGYQHGSLPHSAVEELSGILAKENTITFYTSYGWIFPWALFVTGIVWWGWLFIPQRWRRS
ncbi:MAG: hypothetical protein K8R87_04540 [Verrucomicrobia bacterium]|nr:hypothetical protein [Verrucomicrobiota bacterium]